MPVTRIPFPEAGAVEEWPWNLRVGSGLSTPAKPTLRHQEHRTAQDKTGLIPSSSQNTQLFLQTEFCCFPSDKLDARHAQPKRMVCEGTWLTPSSLLGLSARSQPAVPYGDT